MNNNFNKHSNCSGSADGDSPHEFPGRDSFVYDTQFLDFYQAENPSVLDWTTYNDPANWGDDPTHDATPISQITAARAEQVCTTIWNLFRSHPYTAQRVAPYHGTEVNESDYTSQGATQFGVCCSDERGPRIVGGTNIGARLSGSPFAVNLGSNSDWSPASATINFGPNGYAFVAVVFYTGGVGSAGELLQVDDVTLGGSGG